MSKHNVYHRNESGSVFILIILLSHLLWTGRLIHLILPSINHHQDAYINVLISLLSCQVYNFIILMLVLLFPLFSCRNAVRNLFLLPIDSIMMGYLIGYLHYHYRVIGREFTASGWLISGLLGIWYVFLVGTRQTSVVGRFVRPWLVKSNPSLIHIIRSNRSRLLVLNNLHLSSSISFPHSSSNHIHQTNSSSNDGSLNSHGSNNTLIIPVNV